MAERKEGTVEFRATIPPIQSAIKIGDLGARLQLDIPDSEMHEVVRLLIIKNKRLKVTIEEDE